MVSLLVIRQRVERYESCPEVLRDVAKRGLQTPVTITTEGVSGLSKAVEALGPQSLRIRCGLHKRQNRRQQVPPQAWPACKALVSDLRAAPTVAAAERRRQALVAEDHRDCPAACRCLREEGQASLHPLHIPSRPHQ